MSEAIGRKMVTTRKPHTCFGCGRSFPKGTRMEKCLVVDGGYAWSCYLCKTCVNVSQELDYGDEYGFSELRERALELEAEAALAGERKDGEG